MVRTYLNAAGLVSALGVGVDATRTQTLDRSVLTKKVRIRLSQRETLVGEVSQEMSSLPESFRDYDCRNHRFSYEAIEQIRTTLESYREQYGSSRIGVVVGSSTSGIQQSEQYLLEGMSDFKFDQTHLMSSVGDSIAKFCDVQGPCLTLSTACSSSAKVFAVAQKWLQNNVCDAVIVGGVDSLCELTINGFDSLDSVSQQLNRPLSLNRDGLNIGEGAALFIMSRDPSFFEVRSVGESSDAHHMNAPDPTGQGAYRAMSQAVAQAGLQASEIHYVNLHGTATPLNDQMETKAVDELLGTLPVSSSKPQIGHCLGAAGAIELGILYSLFSQSSEQYQWPPHIYDGQYDPQIPQLEINHTPFAWDRTLNVLSNSFAFGGSNASVCVSLHPEVP